MEHSNNSDNDIETVDVKKDGLLSLQPLADIIRDLTRASDTCKVVLEGTKSIAISIINSVGLDYIDFRLVNAEKLKNALLNNDPHIPPIILIGHHTDEHGSLEFAIEIKFKSIKNGLPEEAFVTLCKSDGHSEWRYDFSDKSWRELTCFEMTGYTQHQINILKNYSDSPNAVLLRHLGPGNAELTDEKLQQLYLKNKEILELHSEVSMCTKIHRNILRERGIVILVPEDIESCDGLSVSFDDGEFRLNAFACSTAVETVYKTPDLADMASVLENMLNRKFRPNLASIVPVSDSTAVVVYKNGECEYMYPCDAEQCSISKAELKIFEKYKNVCKDIANKKQQQIAETDADMSPCSGDIITVNV